MATGRKKSLDERKEMSERMKKLWKIKPFKTNAGKKLSEEHKQKISKSHTKYTDEEDIFIITQPIKHSMLKFNISYNAVINRRQRIKGNK